MIKRLLELLRGSGPQSLAMLAATRKKPSGTDRLYVIRTDFPIKDEMREAFDKSLQPLREKYGLDFLLLEPGITLKRFDDF